MAEDAEAAYRGLHIRGHALEESFRNSGVGELAFHQTCEYRASSLPQPGMILRAAISNIYHISCVSTCDKKIYTSVETCSLVQLYILGDGLC